MKNKKGFTLIELLAVIVILAVLMLIAMPNVLKMMKDSKENVYKNEILAFYKASKTQYDADKIMGNTQDDKNVLSSGWYCYDHTSDAKFGLTNFDWKSGYHGTMVFDDNGKLVAFSYGTSEKTYSYIPDTYDSSNTFDMDSVLNILKDFKADVNDKGDEIGPRYDTADNYDLDCEDYYGTY